MTAPVEVGDILAGKYQVERVLGTGGMGVVVAARHLQLDEHVAIKFLLPEAAARPNLVTRFLREGRAAVKIRSEHVARVFDVGTLENGAPYMVMEYLEGSDLAAIVKEHGPLPVDLALELILQACEAMAEAHVHGIIHRDLKPGNLFLTTRADGTPCLKVIDFGISKITDVSREEAEITGTLETRGSPLFMSPEQMVSTRDVDARSDIWSLGIALYYLLTGEYPFQGSTMPQICGLVLTAEPAPLLPRLSHAPPSLEATLFVCLEKDPADRYQNVGQLASALAPFAPPHALVSVERITRVIAAGGVPPARVSGPSYFQGATPRPQDSSPRLSPAPPLASNTGGGQARARRGGTPIPGEMSPGMTEGTVTSGAASLPAREFGKPTAAPARGPVVAAGIVGVVLVAGLSATATVFFSEGRLGAPAHSPEALAAGASGSPSPVLASARPIDTPADARVVPVGTLGNSAAIAPAPPPAAVIAPLPASAAALSSSSPTATPPTPPTPPSKPPASAGSAKQPPALLRTPPPSRPKSPSEDLFDTPK